MHFLNISFILHTGNDVPFRIGVVALAANQQTSPGGFDLKYIQRGCNNAM